jgi:hypothetical protein
MSRTQVGGSSTSLSVGTVTTGQPGTAAEASITNGALNFTIPQGATGPQGPQGPQGPAGPAGSGSSSSTNSKVLPLYDSSQISFLDTTISIPYIVKGIRNGDPAPLKVSTKYLLPYQKSGTGFVSYPHVAVPNNMSTPEFSYTITYPNVASYSKISGVPITWTINIVETNNGAGWDNYFQQVQFFLGSSAVPVGLHIPTGNTTPNRPSDVDLNMLVQTSFSSNFLVTFSLNDTQEVNANWTVKHKFEFSQNANNGGLVFYGEKYFSIASSGDLNLDNGKW